MIPIPSTRAASRSWSAERNTTAAGDLTWCDRAETLLGSDWRAFWGSLARHHQTEFGGSHENDSFHGDRRSRVGGRDAAGSGGGFGSEGAGLQGAAADRGDIQLDRLLHRRQRRLQLGTREHRPRGIGQRASLPDRRPGPGLRFRPDRRWFEQHHECRRLGRRASRPATTCSKALGSGESRPTFKPRASAAISSCRSSFRHSFPAAAPAGRRRQQP